ncbi:TPA: hypothetical protein NJL90_005203 [Pseudomonas aeruginosa]|nr:hypothetical protein [Pseudomonas aeruginosa]HCG0573344.1 hypothetical protein [Pseudomonas aeruginosa]HCG0579220.1 hypothetical protein [Pseudomonas aeruginosa]HCG0588186.1 hypothetical protein [Pseudomonas aeruginosa]HCG0667750.1 hypothetical protein [Pseudomonas aeruginosa]
MLSIKKNLGLLAMTVALAACASNPNDLPDFPEHEYAATQQVGEGVINGDLYLTSASGAIQKGTNTKVTLEPATSYMKAYYAKFGNLDAAKRDPDVQPPVLDPRRATYVREATTDQNGRFDFDHIPNGTYYISSELTWSAQSDGKTITEGGHRHQAGHRKWLAAAEGAADPLISGGARPKRQAPAIAAGAFSCRRGRTA